MKFHHAAALALAGWYLMVPPVQQSSQLAPNPHAPLKDWSQEGAFDTVERFATAKTELFDMAWGQLPS